MGNCRIAEKYEEIKCALPAWDGDDEGLCLLHSNRSDKDRDGAFTRAVKEKLAREDYNLCGVFFPGPISFINHKFNQKADFLYATFTDTAGYFFASFIGGASFCKARFTGRASFTDATFIGNADFGEAIFNEEADFSGARFIGAANFSRAAFTEKAVFSGTEFTWDADFSEVIFTGKSSWYEATFTGTANFSRARFTGEASFLEASFTGATDFSGTTLAGRIEFLNLNPPRKGQPVLPLFRIDFHWLEFIDQGGLRFQNLSLAHCSFCGTDLRRTEVHNVSWHPLRGRQALYDELLLRQEERKDPWFWTWLSCHAPYSAPPSRWTNRYGDVERLYRYLKIKYESENDYKNAGDFHYGEMEMHRRANRWRWFPCYWYNLYWFLSGYGERPSRALGWLAGFLLALPLLVWGLGLDSIPGGTTPGFLETFTYIFEKATFQRPPLWSNLNLLGRFISNLSLLIIPGQAALFLLALRNRLGRRR